MKSWLKKIRRDPGPRLQDLETVLRAIIDEPAKTDVIASGFVSHFTIRRQGNHYQAVITLELPGGLSTRNEALAARVAQAARLPGVDDVQVIESAHRPLPPGSADDITAGAPQARDPKRAVTPLQNSSHRPGAKPRAPVQKISLPGVRHIITITSGKGGVGKSTIAANIALALAQVGQRVGLMDADIYGPSLPVLFGLTERAAVSEGRIQPVEKFSLKLMSIGLLLDEAQALAWRGPMVMSAIRQLLGEVDWGDLDYLIIDTPPGTGDAHLTLLQSLSVSGSVIVTTPQKMALADVRRGIALLRKMSVPVLGLIENMAWLETENGDRLPLYGPSRGPQIAAIEEIPFLKALPLLPALAAACDQGVPLAVSDRKADQAASAAAEDETESTASAASADRMLGDFRELALLLHEALGKSDPEAEDTA